MRVNCGYKGKFAIAACILRVITGRDMRNTHNYKIMLKLLEGKQTHPHMQTESCLNWAQACMLHMLPNFTSLHMICSKTEMPQTAELAIEAYISVWVGKEMLTKVHNMKCQTYCDLVILNTVEV